MKTTKINVQKLLYFSKRSLVIKKKTVPKCYRLENLHHQLAGNKISTIEHPCISASLRDIGTRRGEREEGGRTQPHPSSDYLGARAGAGSRLSLEDTAASGRRGNYNRERRKQKTLLFLAAGAVYMERLGVPPNCRQYQRPGTRRYYGWSGGKWAWTRQTWFPQW